MKQAKFKKRIAPGRKKAFTAFSLGMNMEQIGLSFGAEQMYRAAMENDPGNILYVDALSRILMMENKLKEANRYLGYGLAQKETAERLWVKAMIEVKEKRSSDALQTASRAMELDKRPEWKYISYAEVLFACDMYRDCFEQIDAAIARDPDFWEFHDRKAWFFSELGHCDEAIEEMDRAFSLCRPDDWYYRKRAMIHKKAEKWRAAFDDYYSALTINPELMEYANQCTALLKQISLDESDLEKMDRLIRAIPDNDILFYARAKLKRKCGFAEEAIADCDRGMRINPASDELLLLKSLCYCDLEDYRSAMDYNILLRIPYKVNPTTGLSEHNPNMQNPNYLYYGSVICMKLQDYSEGLKLIKHALLHSQRDYLRDQLIKLLLLSEQFSEAVKACDAAIEAYPDQARFFIARSKAYEGLRRYGEAIADGEKSAEIGPTDPDAIMRKAEVLIASGQLADAQRTIDSALDDGVYDLDLISLKLDLLMLESGEEEALSLCDRFLNELPSDNRSDQIFFLFRKYRIYAQTGNIDAAVSALDEIGRLGTDPSELQMIRMQYLFSVGRYEASFQACRELLAKDSNSAILHCMCSMRLQKLERYDEAQAEAELALQLDPSEVMYHKNFAYVLIGKGLSNEANDVLSEAIRRDPQDGELHFLKYLILTDLGLAAQAHVSYQTAMRLGYVPGQ